MKRRRRAKCGRLHGSGSQEVRTGVELECAHGDQEVDQEGGQGAGAAGWKAIGLHFVVRVAIGTKGCSTSM